MSSRLGSPREPPGGSRSQSPSPDLVDAGFIEHLNDEVAQIDLTTIDFPAFEGRGEPQWNESVSTLGDDVVCLDRNLIRLAGETPFEACDLATTSGALIHAKRMGQASKATYVFVQAVRSAQLLAESAEARRQLVKHIGDAASGPSRL
jgi:uncharacterized protein (TIGR04141 family)